jgi:CO/xanthine dehydrogenase FAD-binding subunit
MCYWIPKTIKELAEALNDKGDSTYLCAGATDLIIHLREKNILSYSIIDLTHINEIKTIQENGEDLVIGACVNMQQLEKDKRILAYVPALAKAAAMVGSTQIRNLATLGGNIANASQSADAIPVLFAHEARGVIINETGEIMERPLLAVISKDGANTLGQKEALLFIKIKKENVFSSFDKVGSRKAVTISKVNGCIKISVKDNIITAATVYLGAVGRRALQAPYIEEVLLHQDLMKLEEMNIKEAVDKQIESNIPDRPSKNYKKSAAFGCVWNMIEELQQKGAKWNGRS